MIRIPLLFRPEKVSLPGVSSVQSPGTQTPPIPSSVQSREDHIPPASSTTPTRRAPVSAGVLNNKATNRVVPTYPAAARSERASGAVNVQVTIDEAGRVISANAVSGHPLLKESAEQAARGWRFAPTLLSGQPVKITGIITFNFIP